MLLHSAHGYQACWGYLWEASVTLLEATTPVKLPTTQCSRLSQVRHQINKGWYFTNDSTMPERHSFRVSQLSYTSFTQYQCEAIVKVHGVFPSRCGYPASSPDTTISPSSWLRQYPDRCTIRAGRNLPDKEFRYLRTVIVTAAVYRGFSSDASPEG